MPLMSEVKQTGKRGERIGTFLSWMLAVLACLWVAWCCAIGPLYWFGDGAKAQEKLLALLSKNKKDSENDPAAES